MLPLTLYAQKENYNWAFTKNVLFDFNTSPPSITTNIKNLRFGISSISDKNGNLLFYGNANTIYNNNNEAIYTYNDGFRPRYRSVIIKKPNSISDYYMFVIVFKFVVEAKVIKIDVRVDNGVAMVVNSSVLQQIGAHDQFLQIMRHENNNDYWLLVNGENKNQINSYLITENSVELKMTSSFEQEISYSTFSSLKASPDMKKIMYAQPREFVILDFNSSNGVLSNRTTIKHNFLDAHFEFSPNAEKIFINDNSEGLDSMYIKQYPLNLIHNPDAFLNSGTTIYKNKSGRITDLMLGPDNKIYTITAANEYFGIIENPDLSPPNCFYIEEGVYLYGKTSSRNFPNFLRQQSNFSNFNNCNSVHFKYIGPNPLSVRWDFGDGKSSTILDPTHIYTSLGTYTVELIVNHHDDSVNIIKKKIIIEYLNPHRPLILYD